MKAVTVISASGPRRIATAQEEQEAEEQEQTRGVSGIVWAAAGVVAVAAAVVALVLGGGDRPDDREADGPLTPTETTPSDLVPQDLGTAPSVTGTRTDAGVVFRWQTTEELEPGDTWLWQRLDSGDFERTDKDQVVIRTPDDICVEVRLVRGSDQFPATNECVPAG